MTPLVTISMRDGSKGLPGKHTRPFLGKPLWKWTLDAARKWGGAKIIVATDIPEILQEAIHSPEFDHTLGLISYEFTGLRTDIKMLDIRAAASWAELLYDERFNPVIDLDATNPLRLPEHISAAMGFWEECQSDTVISITPGHRHPSFNMVRMDADGEIWLVAPPQHHIFKRQDTREVWDLNCSIYVYDRRFLMNRKNLSPLDGHATGCVMPEWTFRDIDTLAHFEIAECIGRRYLLGD